MTEQLNVQQMAERLCAADNILVLCHKNPDGDTIGCGSALCHALKALGKTAAVLCSDAVAFPLQALPHRCRSGASLSPRPLWPWTLQRAALW